MNARDQQSFIDNLIRLKVFTRLSKVTTMLPPPHIYTNRFTHTLDVARIGDILTNSIIRNYEKKKIYNLKESCYVHDLGHCCFAHEAEQVINNFIATKLCVDEKKVCFSHAVNGALVLALAAKPKRKRTAFAQMDLYKTHVKDMKTIVDSMIKHSFKDYYLGSIYLDYINEEYKNITKRSLLKYKPEDKEPLYKTGFYVMVADDIASKNSDAMDLIQHYHNVAVSRMPPTTFWELSDKYIKDLDNAIRPIRNKFNVRDVYEGLDLFIKEKALLKVTYNFDYKKQITLQLQQVLLEVLNLLCDDPRILRTHFSQKFSYVEKKFIADIRNLNIPKQLNTYTLGVVKSYFYANPYDEGSAYYRVYHRFICTLVYQVSNFTDKDFVDFAYKIRDRLTKSSALCAKNLHLIY